MKKNFRSILIVALFISYFIFLFTNGVGNFQYDNKQLNFMENKYEEIESRYKYLIDNINVGDIEENNREILYLEELRNEILDSLEKNGEFWLIDLNNIIKNKEESLIKQYVKESNDLEANKMYIKLKNEIDEYSMYYNLKEKPIEYSDSLLVKSFMNIFNGIVHQIFLTAIVLFISLLVMNSENYGYIGFWKTSLISVISIISIQLVNVLIWIMIDGVDNIFYPVRVVTDFKNGVGDNILDRAMPFYQVILNTFGVEIIYILFIIGVVKTMDLLFNIKYLKVINSILLLTGIGAISFTKYSGISFFSYGRFFDFTRGYETLYKEGEFLSMKFFMFFFIINMVVLCSVYLYKKYIINDKFLFN